jgi:glycosyltransferase involved in cell wall biosynthesis
MSDNLPRTKQLESKMRIAIVTDAWHPQINGVVKTLDTTARLLQTQGHHVEVVHPGLFKTFACPTYPEIRLAWFPAKRLSALLTDFAPQAIHLATEGPLGSAARKWCRRRQVPFTTSYHTQFPEYLRARAPIPLALSYAALRSFHNDAQLVMVATPTIEQRLRARGFRNIARWSRGVDLALFKPGSKALFPWPRPIWIYVGRLAVEKSVDRFLQLELPGTKVVVGDGPARERLQALYPTAQFVGYKFGAELAAHLAAADVFVFPSRTDTFGLVLLEAMACGVPVAAYPVAGPIDVVQPGVSGVLDQNLNYAARAALALKPEDCRAHALRYTWEAATDQFLKNLSPIGDPVLKPLKNTASQAS